MNLGPALWRLGAICTAYSFGSTLVWILAARALEPIVPALFAAAAYVLTQDVGGIRPRGGGGGNVVKYWRGRRIEDRDDRKRLNAV